jgi:hypothetical protein
MPKLRLHLHAHAEVVMTDSRTSKKLVAVDGELKPGDIDAPRLVLIRKLNSRGDPVGDFAYVAYWATDGNPAQQDQHAELIAAAVNGWQPLHGEIERLQRELADRPALLDGLSIQQWKEHAKAGWKMYAARAENEPSAGAQVLARIVWSEFCQPGSLDDREAAVAKLIQGFIDARAAQPPPAEYVHIGIKRRAEDGRSEYLWWETPAEGAPIYTTRAGLTKGAG